MTAEMTIHQRAATYTTVVAEYYNPRSPQRRTRLLTNGESFAVAFNWGTDTFTTQLIGYTEARATRLAKGRTMVQA